jgi:hypothetical protein
MSALEELTTLVTALGLPVETGVFSGKAPDEYIVVTPMADIYELHADNRPQAEAQEVRLSFFAKGNYRAWARRIVKALLDAGFTVTDRQHLGREDDTGYYHHSIDAIKIFSWE